MKWCSGEKVRRGPELAKLLNQGYIHLVTYGSQAFKPPPELELEQSINSDDLITALLCLASLWHGDHEDEPENNSAPQAWLSRSSLLRVLDKCLTDGGHIDK